MTMGSTMLMRQPLKMSCEGFWQRPLFRVRRVTRTQQWLATRLAAGNSFLASAGVWLSRSTSWLRPPLLAG